MKIVYVGQNRARAKAILKTGEDVILLLFDGWDDYSYKTTFPTQCQVNGREVELGVVQILFENVYTSYKYLDGLIENGWNGVLPIPDTNYISNPSGLEFYEQIEGHIDLENAIEVAEVLRDASYLSVIKEDREALSLTISEGFRKSLQRERGSIKAFLDGWKLFDKKSITIGNQAFKFKNIVGDLSLLSLKFDSDNPLPYDINVVVGPNGVGKSQLLHKIVEDWLDDGTGRSENVGFVKSPNLNQIVVVSYSPFELFPVDTNEDKKLRDHSVYRYFGLRGRLKTLTMSKRGSSRITLSREYPKTNAALSLLACLEDDKRYDAISYWSKKIQTMESVLKQAIDFDVAAVVVSPEVPVDELYNDDFWSQPIYIDHVVEKEGEDLLERYIPISIDGVRLLKVASIKKYIQDRSGVIFLKDGKPVQLSSGQRLFSYIVINILGAIKRNSLILIDEPELFLHPNLEISFIGMLKSILSNYASKALIATHSIVTVREVPRKCVHVFEKTKEGIVVKNPPFETFGGDVQRITSYVFGDKSVSKPYESWLLDQLEKYGSAEELIIGLGEDINEELIVQIKAMENELW